MRELIHFAHGNGFPALCYKQMLNELEKRCDYCYIDKIGHNPLYSVDENWQYLIQELIAHIKKQTRHPLIAVGHSLGGILSIMAAIKEPQLFKAVIMLDSPLFGSVKSGMIKFAKSLGIIDRVTPAYRTKERREHWHTREQLVAYLRSKDLFKTFTEACLNDYITYGLDYKNQGYYLRFDRRIEYQIYRTIPHSIPRYQNQLTVPSALIYGDQSTVVTNRDVRYMKKHFNIKCIKTKGTHVFPMEHPETVARLIMNFIDTL